MLQAATAIRDARRAAGLSQASLASRLGVPQSVVARLERPGSNPTWETVSQALDACGRELWVRARPTKGSIDPTLVARQLRFTPGQRIVGHDHAYADVREFALAAARSRGELV
ncbi:MAG TPA: helix-turn-helix transcriptional regulator [Solirubrobacteraceae bacterium]|nr:helix-turn-helix transcriptional regulator [Solirubrobacteraceae bacterium]